jgi:pimeloyl-ACP methyl ester carboxylesterase
MDTLLHRWFKIPYILHVTEFISPRRPKATVVLIHGIGNSAKAWERIIPMLPKNIRVIGIDLLGFGKSPKPRWAKYDAKRQARSVAATLLKLRLSQRPVLVGHSLGSLVSVELAKRYSYIPKRLILCSPPFYKPTEAKRRLLLRDEVLKSIYRKINKYPQTLKSLSPLIVKLKLANASLDINAGNVAAYTAALEASVINQTSLTDAASLKLPVSILYGTLDPVVIGSNINMLTKGKLNFSTKKIVTGHDITGRYTKILANEITNVVSELGRK